MKMPRASRKEIFRIAAILSLGLYSSFVFARPSQAAPSSQIDGTLQKDARNEKEKEARYMLSTPSSSVAQIEKDTLTDADFSWKAIVHDGPAAGKDPLIGKNSGKPFYDFKDGQPYPYFVTNGQSPAN